MLWVLSLADGAHSLEDMAERAKISLKRICGAADALMAHNLLSDGGTNDEPDPSQKARALDDNPYLEQFRDALADKPVLVTGAGGLIGSALCGTLAGRARTSRGPDAAKPAPRPSGLNVGSKRILRAPMRRRPFWVNQSRIWSLIWRAPCAASGAWLRIPRPL